MKNTPIVVFSNEDLVIVNKPAGLVCYHSKNPADQELSSPNPPCQSCADILCEHGFTADTLFAVNRLDQGTSGLMVFAKTKASARFYSALFKGRKVYKEYIALVEGIWEKGHITVTSPLKAGSKKTFVSTDGGRASLTKITGVRHVGNYSLLNVAIKSGRKHQIRAHLSSLGHPIAGDILYGGNASIEKSGKVFALSWPMLHSCHLWLPARRSPLPERNRPQIETVAPIPDIFLQAISFLMALLFFCIPLRLNAQPENLSIYRNNRAGLSWNIPQHWKKSAPPPLADKSSHSLPASGTKASGMKGMESERGFFSFANGGGQLMISCEPSPADSLANLKSILTGLIQSRKMKIDAPPQYCFLNGYKALMIDSPPQTPHPLDVGRIFIYFTGNKKELSFKMAASSAIWKEAKAQFLKSFDTVSIGFIRKGEQSQATIRDPAGLFTSVLPGGYVIESEDWDYQNLGKAPFLRLLSNDENSVIELSLPYCPNISTESLLEFFVNNIAMTGIEVQTSKNRLHQGLPALFIQAQTSAPGERVEISYYIIKKSSFLLCITHIARREALKEAQTAFDLFCSNVRLVPDNYEELTYTNPSAIDQLCSQPVVRRIETVATVVSSTGKTPELFADEKKTDPIEETGTFCIPTPPDYPPYQNVTIEGWSKAPFSLRADSNGNMESLFITDSPGRRARERVSSRWTISSFSNQISPIKGTSFSLPLNLSHRYLSESPGVPREHPRIEAFCARLIKEGTTDPVEIAQILLKGVARFTRGSQSEEGVHSPANGNTADSQSVQSLSWGQGALFALTHPSQCGPSERVNLLASCLRDKNIPVKRLYGYLVSADGNSLSPHAWCEVFIPPTGWIPADPSFISSKEPEFGLWSDRYILLSAEGPRYIQTYGPDKTILEEGTGRKRDRQLSIDVEMLRRILPQTITPQKEENSLPLNAAEKKNASSPDTSGEEALSAETRNR